MVKITCQSDSKKSFVIDGLLERSTIAALKAYIEEKASEGIVTISKQGKELPVADHLSLQKAGIKDGDTISFSVKPREQKAKPVEKKKPAEPVVVEVKEKKRE